MTWIEASDCLLKRKGLERESELLDLVEPLLRQLPHGSGIDCSWTVQVYRGRIDFSNSFHAMNDVGMYDGWGDFRALLLPVRQTRLLRLKGPLKGRYQQQQKKGELNMQLKCRFPRRRSFYGLREYLDELLWEFFSSSIPVMTQPRLLEPEQAEQLIQQDIEIEQCL